MIEQRFATLHQASYPDLFALFRIYSTKGLKGERFFGCPFAWLRA